MDNKTYIAEARGVFSCGTALLRPLTEENLKRLTKGCEKAGYAIVSVKPGAGPARIREDTDRLIEHIRKSHCSYLCVYALPDTAANGESIAATSVVVFPFGIQRNISADFTGFCESMTGQINNQARDNESEWSISVYRPNDGDLLLSLRHRIAPYGCYIQTPPASMQIGHYRWATGDINHIYKELKNA